MGGNGYAVDGVQTAFWPVGYPLALAFVYLLGGQEFWPVALSNIIFAAVTVALIFDLGRRLFGLVWAGLCAATVVAFLPNQVAYASLASSEPLYLMVLTGAVWFFVSSPASASGAIFGSAFLAASTFIKPQSLLVLPILAAYFILKSEPERRQYAVMFTALGLLLYVGLLAPWIMRNREVFGSWVFVSTNAGYNLLIGHNPATTGKWMEVRQMVPPDANEAVLDAKFRGLAIFYIRQDPLRAFRTLPSKAYYFVYPATEGIDWNVEGLKPIAPSQQAFLSPLKPIARSATLLVLLASVVGYLVGVALHRRKRVRFSHLPALVAAIPLLLALAMFGSSRFHYPAVPFIAMYVPFLALLWCKPPREVSEQTVA
ncbi:MAG: ArnT family glycosyltransferase [Fimbriimonadaceae bacterium]